MTYSDHPIKTDDSFGCDKCYRATAEAFWNERPPKLLRELVDELHFRVVLMACEACGQRWVKVFAETIDWVDGEDPQFWALAPLTAEEADQLTARGEGLDAAWIETLMGARQHLEVHNPKNQPHTIAWASGPLVIMPHD